MTTATEPQASKLDRFVASYRQDHTHPVNHFLHVGVGWPLCALAVILLPMRLWWWSLGLFLAGYAFMWFGHFVFEGNIPTVLKHPSTPIVMAWAVSRGLLGALARAVGLSKPR